jgi:hypothetical protein
MGGIGSGNHGGKLTVEGGLTLTLGRLIRDGLFRPGLAWGGSIVWTNTRTGQKIATVGYEAHMVDPADSWASPAPRLIGTPRKRTISATEVCHER